MRRRKASAGGPTLFPLEDAPSPALPEVSGGYCDVALNRPMHCEYTYAVPEPLRGAVRPGTRVVVPFANRRVVGVVVAERSLPEVNTKRLKSVTRLLDEEPVVDADMLALSAWMAQRYGCSWGEALAAILPAPLKREAGSRKVLLVKATSSDVELATLEDRFPKQHRLLRTLQEIGEEVEARDLLRRLNLSDSPLQTLMRKGWVTTRRVAVQADELLSSRVDRPRPEKLTEHQGVAVEAIVKALEAGGGRTFLLRGVTGSGKTEVYLRAIEHARAAGRGAIVLVPEIALTPQTVGWFRARFGDIAVLHSKMTDSQRLQMWRRARRGEARVVVGARSAVFAPVPDLGVIVVDEEHEPSFKQGNTPRYHARDVAVERARQAGAICVLGSATPSLESWRRAGDGEYGLLTLPERVGGAGLPAVDVVDMRLESEHGIPLFSRLLKSLLAEVLEEKEQAILFLNRRGFTPVLWCPGCQEVLRCQDCTIGLTLHRKIKRLVCHGCCHELAVPEACPTCSRPGLRLVGAGSERVEREIATLFPAARVRRMDSDTMRRREDYEETLDEFGRGAIDILVGTQMIAKGLDFPNVTVVGIISADQALHLPDFRSSERTFQLIAQVAGRAGRGDRLGRIVVQTSTPEEPAVALAASHDFEAFAEVEQVNRRRLGYPPFARLIRVVFEDSEMERAREASEQFARAASESAGDGVEVLGPVPAAIAMLRGRHRFNMLVKAPLEGSAFDRVKDRLVELAASTRRPQVAIDVDAVSML